MYSLSFLTINLHNSGRILLTKSYSFSMLQGGQIRFQQDIREKAVTEALKEHAKKEEQFKQNLDELVEKSTHTLLKICSHQLFSLTTTDLIVDIDQVSIRSRTWFGSSQLIGISIKDIGSVTVDVGPFYASLTFIGTRPGPETTHIVSYLRRNEASRARRIIQGLIVASKEEIDLSLCQPEEVVDKLETLGQTQAIE